MRKVLIVFILVIGFKAAQAQNFSTHYVKVGETVEGLAKRYFVSAAEIYQLNPDAKKELKPNTVLIIPISKAKKPVVIQKKELKGFLVHKTKRKETLYSLAKEYNVSEGDIKKYNSFLYANPLRKGDKLKIPNFKTTQVLENTPNKTVVTNKNTYKVLPKEGKWRVAYKFGITINELEALNPNMADVLNPGDEIIVPNLDKGATKKIDDTFSYYEVLPKEGFYRLKLKLGLNQDELETLNPELKEIGLKSGMVLKIPLNNEATTVLKPFNVVQGEPLNLANKIVDFSMKHIAVMLPFRMHRVNFDSTEDTKKSLEKAPYLNASLDFHSGVLMAIDSLKALGVSLKVDVYDTRYDVNEVARIMRENDFKNTDAVIGPLTSDNFNKVALELKNNNTPVISPIGTKLNLFNNVFQSRPENKTLIAKVVSFVKRDTLPNNVVIISDSKNMGIANSLKKEFASAKIVYSRKDKEGKDEFFVTKEDIEAALKPGKNSVFLETENGGYASNVTSVLASLNKRVNPDALEEAPPEICLFTTSMNAAFQGEQINNTHLSTLKFHFATASKEYEGTNSFVKKYNRKYNITPNNRAVKGFDLTMDVVLRLVSSQDLYTSVDNAPLTEYVENKFAYKKSMLGGFVNESVYLVKYDNLSVVEVK